MTDLHPITRSQLREARRRRGLSQEALARMAGVSRTYVATLEKADCPSQIVEALETYDRDSHNGEQA